MTGTRMMTMRAGVLAAVFASLIAGFAARASAAEAERGKVLYEMRCNACHESSVHNRNARKAKSFAGLRAQVLRWSAQVGGAWSEEEIDSVTQYLNQRYYRFPCPRSACKADQASLQITSKH